MSKKKKKKNYQEVVVPSFNLPMSVVRGDSIVLLRAFLFLDLCSE